MAIGGLNLVQAELQSPFQQATLPGPGLDLSAGVEAIPSAIQSGQAVEAKQQQRTFEDLLATGKEGMIKMAESLVEEGSLTPEDIAKMDPNLPAFQSQEGQVIWYEGIDKKVKENTAKKQAGERAELEGRELLKTGVEQGVIKPTEQLEAQAGFERQDRVKEFIESLGGKKITEPKVSPDEIDVVVLQTAIDDIDSKIQDANTAGVSSDPDVRPVIKNLQNQKKDLQKRIRERGVETRSVRNLEARQSEQTLKSQEKFLKDTKSSRAIKSELSVVDSALKEMGLPDGIETLDPGSVNIPGAGTFGQNFRRFVKTPAGVKFLANVERVIAEDRHSLFGSALTTSESKNFKAMIGRNFLGNERQFLAALRAMKRVNEESLVGTVRQEAILEKTEKKKKPDTKKTDKEETEEEKINREFRELF